MHRNLQDGFDGDSDKVPSHTRLVGSFPDAEACKLCIDIKKSKMDPIWIMRRLQVSRLFSALERHVVT